MTPLMEAAARGYARLMRRFLDPGIVRLLVAHGSDISRRDWYRRSPLSEAMRGGHGEVAAFLPEQGAPYTLTDAALIDELAGGARFWSRGWMSGRRAPAENRS
jgi:Ankyrin repeat.